MNTPKNFRLHISLFGRRNVGKSSLLNALSRQQISIVSDIPGTTTDPVHKPIELPTLGPVLLMDTAGVDDPSSLGAQRIAKTHQVLDQTDLALLVTDSGRWTPCEESLLQQLSERQIPTIIVFNKSDLARPTDEVLAQLAGKSIICLSAQTGEGLTQLYQALLNAAPEDFFNRPSLAADLVPEGKTAILVTPIDSEAPKGRLILPQVQTLRDLLDAQRLVLVCRETQLSHALASLTEKPAIVITDSQAFQTINRLTPPDILLTSFSVLFARFQGDLAELARGARSISRLRPGDKILIAEACSHHPAEEDIGTVKIPRLLNHFVGGPLQFDTAHGTDFPQNLSSYKLVIHCGACMWNRRAMLNRILFCKQQSIPITNYGLTIAFALNILERALQPFPDTLAAQ